MSAMAISEGWCVGGAGGDQPPPAPLRSAIDSLQLPFGVRDRALGILAAGAVIGEHIDHDEVRDRGRGLFTGRADAEAGSARLLAWANTAFFGSAVQTGAES